MGLYEPGHVKSFQGFGIAIVLDKVQDCGMVADDNILS